MPKCDYWVLPVDRSLEFRGTEAKWVEFTPLLNVTLNKVNSDHPILTDTFLLEMVGQYVAPHLDDLDPPAELVDALKKMNGKLRGLNWYPRTRLELPEAEMPALHLLQDVSEVKDILFRGHLFNYDGHECKVNFIAICQLPFTLDARGV